MRSFKQHIEEAKNTHMEHIEDMIFNDGVKGARSAINFLQGLRDLFSGDTRSPINTTVKWDGAPAIFAGLDPRDGKFFIAKKGIFNANPKIYKTDEEIDADLSGDLATKFKLALQYLPALGIKNVIQGDFLYDNASLTNQSIDGEKMITFHPNTIVYTVPIDSPLGKQIKSSKIGIVWHTQYVGDNFENMNAVFGKSISNELNKSRNVWHTDAIFKDVSGTANMTKSETDKITTLLSNAGKSFRNIKSSTLNAIATNDEVKMRIKTHFNTLVRQGKRISDTKKHVRELLNYMIDYYDKEIDKRKTARGRDPLQKKKEEAIKFFSKNNMSDIENIFKMMGYIIQAKEMIVKKMDSASSIGTFLKTKKGFVVTNPEGYVAINRDGDAIKLVNRLEFSKANFNSDVIKGWEKL